MELTSLEQQILAAILALKDNGYGVSIQAKIDEVVGDAPSLGSIYASLDRLADRGLIVSSEGEATSQRGGRRKSLFALTESGRAALGRSLQAVSALARAAGIATPGV